MSDAEKIVPYALTSINRVKDRLSLSEPNFDVVLGRIISGVTDFIEGECGGRRFLSTTYTNQVITIFNLNQRMLALKNFPITAITSVQYRTGTKSNPNYTEFSDDDWEIIDDGSAGLVRVFGLTQEVNAIRISYTGGYKINWEKAGDVTLHNLPADLSDLAERLTVKIFKKRDHEGKLSETFEGSTVTYGDLLDDDTKAIINRYRRLPQFV